VHSVIAKQPLAVGFHVPEDDTDLLAALGEISIRHGHLDHLLRMIIKRFTDVTAQEAMDATAKANSSELRRRVKKLARMKFGEGAALVKMQALVEECRRITERRNALIHILCGKDSDGNAIAATEDLRFWKPMPPASEVRALAGDMDRLSREIQHARSLWGFIEPALKEKKGGQGT
jgi:hypothetical protein